MPLFDRSLSTDRLYRWFFWLLLLEVVALVYFTGFVRLRSATQTALPWWLIASLRVNLLIFLTSVTFIFRDRWDEDKKRIAYVIGLLVATTFGLDLVSLGSYRIMFDEHIYLHVAQVISAAGKAAVSGYGDLRFGTPYFNFLEFNKEPNTFPFFISVVTQIFGFSEAIVFRLNGFLFGVSILGTFFLGKKIFVKTFYASLAAFFFALSPMNLQWFNGLSAEPITIAFGVWTIWALLELLDRPESHRMRFLTISLFVFMVQTRPESALIALPMLAIFLSRRHEPSVRRLFPILGIFIMPLLFVHFTHFNLVRNEDWGAPATGKFSTVYFWKNLTVNASFYFIHERVNAVLGLLALVGVIFSEKKIARIYLSTWFGAFFLILLFFYAGSYNYGADVRFSTLTSVPLCLLAALGVLRIVDFFRGKVLFGDGETEPKILAFVGLLFFVSSLSLLPQVHTVTQEGMDSRFGIYFTRDALRRIPPYSLVYTHIPSLWLSLGQSAANVGHLEYASPEMLKATLRSYPGGIYLDWGSWCSYANGSTPHGEACARILAKFPVTVPVAEEPFFDRRFVLYRIHPQF